MLVILLIPGNTLWVAVLVLTLLVKLFLAPFSYRALVAQVKNKKIQPLVEQIKKDHPDDKQLQAQKQLEIYQKMKVNPFSGCLPTIVNLAVILGLFRLFRDGNIFDETMAYSFIKVPESLNTAFIGIPDITEAVSFTGKALSEIMTELSLPIIILALVAGLSQFIQVRLSPTFKKMKKAEPKEGDELNPMTMMQDQLGFMMKYGLPVMIVFFGITFPPALTMYWIVNNIFTIVQELVVRGRLDKIEADIDLQLKEVNL